MASINFTLRQETGNIFIIKYTLYGTRTRNVLGFAAKPERASSLQYGISFHFFDRCPMDCLLFLKTISSCGRPLNKIKYKKTHAHTQTRWNDLCECLSCIAQLWIHTHTMASSFGIWPNQMRQSMRESILCAGVRACVRCAYVCEQEYKKGSAAIERVKPKKMRPIHFYIPYCVHKHNRAENQKCGNICIWFHGPQLIPASRLHLFLLASHCSCFWHHTCWSGHFSVPSNRW